MPSEFDILYASNQCDFCIYKNRDKRFLSALIKGLCRVT